MNFYKTLFECLTYEYPIFKIILLNLFIIPNSYWFWSKKILLINLIQTDQKNFRTDPDQSQKFSIRYLPIPGSADPDPIKTTSRSQPIPSIWSSIRTDPDSSGSNEIVNLYLGSIPYFVNTRFNSNIINHL